MKQDVTVDGIPTHIDHCHKVDININVDEETAKNVATVAVTIIGALAVSFMLKQTTNYSLRALGDVVYKATWKVAK